MNNKIIISSGIVFFLTIIALFHINGEKPTKLVPIDNVPVLPAKPEVHGPYAIKTQIPSKYLNYEEVKDQLLTWQKEAPHITKYAAYGSNRQNTELVYLRIGTPGKPKILIHSCIHGNERLAAAATLGIMGKMLHDYQRNPEVTWIVDNREIYFVPVFSPESYLSSRHIEQGDPNRNWPYPGSSRDNTSSPIMAMRKFFLEQKFVAAVDGHTYGRDFFYPSIAKGEDRTKIAGLAKDMSDLAKYDPNPVGNGPAGYAIDWYYWNGAVSILTEFGTGTHEQSISSIATETERTYSAYLHFMKAAPEIKLQGIPNNTRYIESPSIRNETSACRTRRRWRD